MKKFNFTNYACARFSNFLVSCLLIPLSVFQHGFKATCCTILRGNWSTAKCLEEANIIFEELEKHNKSLNKLFLICFQLAMRIHSYGIKQCLQQFAKLLKLRLQKSNTPKFQNISFHSKSIFASSIASSSASGNSNVNIVVKDNYINFLWLVKELSRFNVSLNVIILEDDTIANEFCKFADVYVVKNTEQSIEDCSKLFSYLCESGFTKTICANNIPLELMSIAKEHGLQISIQNIELVKTSNAIFEILGALSIYFPKISVVIPNYNYEHHLGERLSSILNQSFPLYEIIFLDDASVDKSVEFATNMLNQHNITYHLVKNEENSGSPFKQWIKGVELCSGDFIWIAEADDFCETNLLEQVMPAFDDTQTVMAYCKSCQIDRDSNLVDDGHRQYIADLSDNKWESSHTSYGKTEIVQLLSIKNTIPNASAVIFKKFALMNAIKGVENFRFSGDYFTYVACMAQGNIAFIAEELNYHRRHEKSVIGVGSQSTKFYDEYIKNQTIIADKFLIPENLRNNVLRATLKQELHSDNAFQGEWINFIERLCLGIDNLKNIIDGNISKFTFLQGGRKKILIILPDFQFSSCQVSVLKLANFLSIYHNVYLYPASLNAIDEDFTKCISRSVILLPRIEKNSDLLEQINTNQIDIINSHSLKGHEVSIEIINNLDMENMIWVASHHACDDVLLNNASKNEESHDLMQGVLHKAHYIVYTLDTSLESLAKIATQENLDTQKFVKIYGGTEHFTPQLIDKSSLNIDENAFVFGQILQGKVEEGAEIAIEAFQRMIQNQDLNAHLVLVSKSDYISSLQEKYKTEKCIHFVKKPLYQDECFTYTQIFDVCLLPAYDQVDSSIAILAEYLAYSKPVIASDFGEIASILSHNDKSAGLIVKRESTAELQIAMEKILNCKDLYNQLSANVETAFEQFNIKNTANSYGKLLFSKTISFT